MNPFEKNSHNNYSSFVESQIEKIKIGESSVVDLGWKDIQDFRMTLAYVSQRSGGLKFKTRKAKDGSLWIKRIA
jgi:hypothetical protein